jgi:hypothetical protein
MARRLVKEPTRIWRAPANRGTTIDETLLPTTAGHNPFMLQFGM